MRNNNLNHSYVSCDTETTGTALHHGCRPFLTCCYSPLGKKKWDHTEYIDPMTREIAYPQDDLGAVGVYLHKFETWVFHNAKFDIRALLKSGLMTPTQLTWENVHDTYLMAHVLDSREHHGLKELGLKYLDILDSDEKDLEKATQSARRKAKKLGWKTAEDEWTPGKFKQVWRWDYWLSKRLDPTNNLCETYCYMDVERTLKLFIVFKHALHQEGLWEQYEYERKLLPIVYALEERGVEIDMPELNKKDTLFFQRKKETVEKIVSVARTQGLEKFNPASPVQMKVLLLDKLGMVSPKETDKGNPSLDADSLDFMHKQALMKKKHKSARVLSTILDMRQAETGLKYCNQYRSAALMSHPPLLDDSFNVAWTIHGSANQCGTGTTRFSFSNPNLQNVGKGDEDEGGLFLRPVFKPRTGHFWYDIDYANLELRLFAWMSGDKRLQKAFMDGHGVNLLIAREFWGDILPENDGEAKKTQQYRWTKNFIYAVLYGAGETKADATLGQSGGYRKFRKRFPTIDRFSQACMSEAKEFGYVTTLLGYRLEVPKTAIYAATDYKIQGTAGGIFKRGLINAVAHLAEREPRMYPILPVHDEVVYEGPVDLMRTKHNHHNRIVLQGIIEGMESPGWKLGIPTPVEVDIVTTNWGERKGVELPAKETV